MLMISTQLNPICNTFLEKFSVNLVVSAQQCCMEADVGP